MSKDIVLETANSILAKYNLELRYAEYGIHEPLTADLIVKDSKKDFHLGLINMTKDKIIKFYVGEVHFYAAFYDVANKFREELMQLYQDVDKLNKLALLYTDDN